MTPLETYKGPQSRTAIAQNLYVRMMVFANAGDRNDGHSHPYDHLTLLASGRLRVSVEGRDDVELVAPTVFLTPKGLIHRFVALEDNTVVTCMHALRDEAGNIIPQDTSVAEAAAQIRHLTE